MVEFNTKEVLERIEIEIAKLGMSKETFYAKSGISSASFAQWKSGKHEPTTKKLALAANTLNVSLEYLINGNISFNPVQKNNSLTETVSQLVSQISSSKDSSIDEQFAEKIFKSLPEDKRLKVMQYMLNLMIDNK